MRVLRNASASRTTLASLGALYVLVVVLTVVLINRILVDPLDFDFGFAWVLVALGILFPLGLLVAVGISVARLVRDRHQNRPGSGFKARLTGFFALVVFLAAVPQGIVSVSFLSAGLDILFRTDTARAIRDGLGITLDYYENEVHDLRVFAADGSLTEILNRNLDEVLSEPADAGSGAAPASAPASALWNEVNRRIPTAAAIQVFDAAGAELLFRGARVFARSAAPPLGVPGDEPAVTRSAIAGEAVLQLVTPVGIGAGSPEPGGNGSAAAAATAVVTARLPAGLEETARRLTDAQELFARFSGVRSTVLTVLAAVYGVFTAPILLLSIMAGFFLSDRIMRPIESLEDATRRVADGDYTVRILTRPGDDLGVLVVSFNRMVTELDRARRRMAQAEKVQAWQEIAQRLAHEVKNPLTPIKLAAERLQRRYVAGAPDFGDVLSRTVDTIVREVDALTALLNEFRSFSRMPEPSVAAVDLSELFRDIAAVYRDNPDVTVTTEGVPEGTTVEADRGQLRQVFTNLMTNSVEAAAGRVSVAISAHVIQRGRETICRIRVEDDGPGIPEELRDSLFEPYVTSKNRGTGLGLAIVERIVFDHDGRISFESAPGSGTTFVVDLPVEQPR